MVTEGYASVPRRTRVRGSCTKAACHERRRGIGGEPAEGYGRCHRGFSSRSAIDAEPGCERQEASSLAAQEQDEQCQQPAENETYKGRQRARRRNRTKWHWQSRVSVPPPITSCSKETKQTEDSSSRGDMKANLHKIKPTRSLSEEMRQRGPPKRDWGCHRKHLENAVVSDKWKKH